MLIFLDFTIYSVCVINVEYTNVETVSYVNFWYHYECLFIASD